MALRQRGDQSRIRAGDLNIRVYVKRDTQTTDNQGGRTGTPATLDTVWASIEPTGATRAQAHGITMVQRPSDVIVRYNSDITLDEDCYLEEVVSGRVHYIQEVNEVNRRKRIMKLIVTEKK